MARCCYARFCRKGLVCYTLIVLTYPIIGNSQSNQDLSSDGMLLKIIRDQVIRNEKSFNLIKMSHGTQFDYTIPESELQRYRNTPGRRTVRRTGGVGRSHNVGIWAQDGVKQHASTDSYYGLDDLTSSTVTVVNGEVMKWAAKPDFMRGGIDHLEKFKWSRVGPQHLGLRPLGYYKLSELLAPENAIIHQEREWIGGREAYVIDAKRPFREPPYYYVRIWIDAERYMPLEIQHYGLNDPSSSNARPHSEVIGIKLHQLPNGGWFPVEGTRVRYYQKPRPYERLSHIVVDVNSITIQREDIPESLFEINFPEGARIHNAILGITAEQGKGESRTVEGIINNSIEQLGASTPESDTSPDSNQTPTTVPPTEDEQTQPTTEDSSKPPRVEPPSGRGFSFILISVPIAITAFSLTLIISIIRHKSRISGRGESK